jgi:hypothetical protein
MRSFVGHQVLRLRDTLTVNSKLRFGGCHDISSLFVVVVVLVVVVVIVFLFVF